VFEIVPKPAAFTAGRLSRLAVPAMPDGSERVLAMKQICVEAASAARVWEANLQFWHTLVDGDAAAASTTVSVLDAFREEPDAGGMVVLRIIKHRCRECRRHRRFVGFQCSTIVRADSRPRRQPNTTCALSFSASSWCSYCLAVSFSCSAAAASAAARLCSGGALHDGV
jgi:hypothetical protein